MRRFRNKKDLYRYLDQNLVSIIDYLIFKNIFLLSLANTLAKIEGLLLIVPPNDSKQPEATFSEESSKESEGSSASRAGR